MYTKFYINSVFKRTTTNLFLNSTWTQEDGYKNPLDLYNYPANAMGGIFGDRLFLVLVQKRGDIEPLCAFFSGFKVKSLILQMRLCINIVKFFKKCDGLLIEEIFNFYS